MGSRGGTCWESRLAVGNGGAYVSGRGLWEGKPGATAGHAWRAAANVPTRDGGGRSRPTEAELVVPSPVRGTRANALVDLHKSIESKAETLEPPRKKNERGARTLEPPAGVVMERRQRRATPSSQEF